MMLGAVGSCIMTLFSLISNNIGVTYSPSGLLTPYQVGVSRFLVEKGIIDDSTVIAGTSGGALAALSSVLFVKEEFSSDKLLDACEYVAYECLKYGTRGTLRKAFDQVLNDLVPDNIDSLNNRNGKIIISYKQILPNLISCFVSSFHNKTDLIDVVRASCNIPFYFNGNQIFVKVRGGSAVDGILAVPRYRFGCPETNCPFEIFVTPFSPNSVRLHPNKWMKLKSRYLQRKNITNSISEYDYSIISPDELPVGTWPFQTLTLLQLALTPPNIRSVKDIPNIEHVSKNELLRNIERLSQLRKESKSTEEINQLSESIRKGGIRLIYEHLYQCGRSSAEVWFHKNIHLLEKHGYRSLDCHPRDTVM